MKKALLYFGNFALTVVGAFHLVGFFLNLPFNMPDAVDWFLRAMLHIAGHDEMANPDDMADLAVLLYSAVGLAIVGFAVFGLNVFVRWFARTCVRHWRQVRRDG